MCISNKFPGNIDAVGLGTTHPGTTGIDQRRVLLLKASNLDKPWI